MGQPALECEDLEYWESDEDLLHRLSFRLEFGQGGLILTDSQIRSRLLLRICATMGQPSKGKIRWFGRFEEHLTETQLVALRRRIGWVHREARLVSNLTLLDNIVLGLIYHRNLTHREAHSQVQDLMKRFNIYDYRNLRPAEISFDLQRTALYVREMAKQPRLFLFEAPALDLDQGFGLLMQEISELASRGESAFIISDITAKEALPWVDWVLILNNKHYKLLAANQFDPVRDGNPTRWPEQNLRNVGH